MSSSWRLRHYPGLDGLRGLAVLGVVAFHASEAGSFRLTGGYLGVDLFFVLSGFLITSLLLGEQRDTDSVKLGSFWGRRARRLLPAVLIVLAVVAILSRFLATSAEIAKLRADGLATLFYVANWRSIFGQDSYWAMFDSPSPLQHTWSLAIEEQFYVFWPLVVFGLIAWKRRSPVAVLVVASLGAVASVIAMQFLFREGDTTRAYFGTDTRIAAIFLGCALAAAFHRWGHVPTGRARYAVEFAALLGLGWLAYAWWTIDGQDPFLYRAGFLLCEIAVLALIASVTHPEEGVIGKAFSFKPLCWVGLVSYGLYLWHWPVFVFANESRLHVKGIPLLALQLMITFAVAAASFYLIERPIRRGWRPKRPSVGWWVAPAAMGLTAVVILAMTFSAAPSVTSDDVAAALAAPPAGNTGANTGGAVPGAQAAGQPASNVPVRQAARAALGRNPRVLVAGDSVAFTVAAGLVPYQETLGVEVKSEAVIACGVARGDGRFKTSEGQILTESAECHNWPTRWSDTIAAFRPDVALLVVGWPGHTTRLVEGEWRGPCDPAFDRFYEGEVREALRVLHAQGTKVAFTTVPYYRSPKAPEGTDAKTDCLNSMYRRLAGETGTAIVELAEHVCPGGTCRIEDENGVQVRPDGLHFDGPSGTFVGAWVLDRALEPVASTSPKPNVPSRLQRP